MVVMSKMKKLFMAIPLIILIIGLGLYFFTLEVFQSVEVFRMKSEGVHSVVDSSGHYFEKNNCVGGEKCQCVLLIHGLGDFALTWRQMLSENKASFAQATHFFAPNLPGALATPKLYNTSDYNVQKLAQKISNDFLPKCESWIVVGNSYGGWMAVFMALNSEKIKGLLLLGPAGLNKDYSHITNYFLNPTVSGAKDFYHRLYANPKNVPDFIFKRVVERAKTQPVVDQLRTITENDYLDSHLKNLKIPVRYVWGEADGVIPAAWAKFYADLTPNSHLEFIKGCGHVPQKECFREVLPELNELLIF